jgi:hypothetical protein
VTVVGNQIGEVCTCGHPMRVHHANGKCEFDRLNCLCSNATPFLVTRSLQGYLRKHGRGSIGHALMQGAISSYYETSLSLGSGSAELRCYKCKAQTWELAPVLMDTHSKQISDNPEQGRMTRLWCKDCLASADRDYPPYLGFLIYREVFQTHHPDS